MMTALSWAYDLLNALAVFMTLVGASHSIWRWRRTSKRIETPDRDSLSELKDRHAAASEARQKFPSRVAYQAHQAQEFAGMTAVFTPMVGALVLIVILQIEFGGPIAFFGAFTGVLGVALFFWTASVFVRLTERRRLIAADLDQLDRLERRIEFMEANPLS